MPRPLSWQENICPENEVYNLSSKLSLMRKLFLLLLALLAVPAMCAVCKKPLTKKIRVACVGNSVTYGYGLTDREHDSYPTQLGEMLGQDYEVRNFGHSGATLTRHGFRPYQDQQAFHEALTYQADLVVIHLGLNDTDPRCWPQHRDEFIHDYRALIDTLRTANPNCRVWICLMTPIFAGHHRWESGTREWHHQIQERIRQIAATTPGVGLIDLYTPLHARPDLFDDNLHPNAEGAKILTQTVYSALTGDFGPLRLEQPWGDGMVLLRGRPIEVHGLAAAGTEVQVSLGKRDLPKSVKAHTVADESGHWLAKLPAMEAGGPYRFEVIGTHPRRVATSPLPAAGRAPRKERLTLDSVWIGEVWLCSGQSNMAFELSQCATAQEDIREADSAEACSRFLHFLDLKPICPTTPGEWTASQLDSVGRLLYLPPGEWKRCSRQTAARFSAIGYHFGRTLADSLRLPIGLICNAVGGSPTESWVSREVMGEEIPALLRNLRRTDYQQSWVRERANDNCPSPTLRHPYDACYLWENGMEGLHQYPLRGMTWYQGESNAHNVELHERLFRMMERSLRQQWPGLPVYMVQLSSLEPRLSWPHFRDSQRRLALSEPATYMAVCSDLGDRLDVHPREKRQVGQRLAREALYYEYGRSGLVPSGPEIVGAKAEDQGRVRLHFNWAKGLHTSDGSPLRGFEVCGADGLYHTAVATIQGDEVILSAGEVKGPLQVRYGWQPFTTANLVNGEELPCSTFQVDVAAP